MAQTARNNARRLLTARQRECNLWRHQTSEEISIGIVIYALLSPGPGAMLLLLLLLPSHPDDDDDGGGDIQNSAEYGRAD